MTPILDYITTMPYPRQTSAAEALGVSKQQITRWKQVGAYIHDNGTVYVPARKQRNRRVKQ
jgi:hypothetical protein